MAVNRASPYEECSHQLYTWHRHQQSCLGSWLSLLLLLVCGRLATEAAAVMWNCIKLWTGLPCDVYSHTSKAVTSIVSWRWLQKPAPKFIAERGLFTPEWKKLCFLHRLGSNSMMSQWLCQSVIQLDPYIFRHWQKFCFVFYPFTEFECIYIHIGWRV